MISLPFLLTCAQRAAEEELHPPNLCAFGWRDAF